MCWIKLVYARRSLVSFIQVTLDRIISVLRSPVCLSVRAWWTVKSNIWYINYKSLLTDELNCWLIANGVKFNEPKTSWGELVHSRQSWITLTKYFSLIVVSFLKVCNFLHIYRILHELSFQKCINFYQPSSRIYLASKLFLSEIDKCL